METLIVDREMTGFVCCGIARPDGVSLPSRKRIPDRSSTSIRRLTLIQFEGAFLNLSHIGIDFPYQPCVQTNVFYSESDSVLNFLVIIRENLPSKSQTIFYQLRLIRLRNWASCLKNLLHLSDVLPKQHIKTTLFTAVAAANDK